MKNLLLLLAATIVAPAFAQVVPFDSDRWVIDANDSRIEEYQGHQSLFLKGGVAYLRDSEFLNGTIEFDIMVTGERGFMGGFWRMIDRNNREEFYIRPHQSGKPDANQYTPIFNRVSGWQLYHGEGFGAQIEYKFNQWMHIKIAIHENTGEVYIMDMDQPVLVIHELKRDPVEGMVGVSAGNFVHARFANFQYTAASSQELTGEFKELPRADENSIMRWMVSEPYIEDSVKNILALGPKDLRDADWKLLESEDSGLANLSRVADYSKGTTVFVRVDIETSDARAKMLSFGYSDRVKVFLNGDLLYSGNNGYLSRDFRYLGTIGYFDEVLLNLDEGDNQLVFMVSESFGGWGIQAKFSDLEGISLTAKD